MTDRLRRISMVVCVVGAVSSTDCVAPSLVEVQPPNSVTDPAVVTTASGAQQLYLQALSQWSKSMGGTPIGDAATGLPGYVVLSGEFTDELMRVQGSSFGLFGEDGIDVRNDGSIPGVNFSTIYVSFTSFSTNRNSARQAREALVAYAPATPPAWRARLQAEEGYAIIYTAELFCSGMPLSTRSFTGDVVLTRGFTTEEMLAQALVLFDSATTLAGDSTRFRYLAKVGKGRALLDLGRFADAVTAVADVPTDFVYLLEHTSATAANNNVIGNRPQNLQVRDREGGNGLVWSTDPRTVVVTTPTLSGTMPVPGKYSVTAGGVVAATTANPTAPVRGADGLEARLIEAEATLALNDPSWLAKLNALRATCVGTAVCAPVPGLTAATLPPLTDPGTTDARLDLLMRERAMWLYLTAHRQGDLRRMAHVYHRDPLTLWPVGLYINPGFPPQIPATVDNGIASYLNTFVATQPTSREQQSNPLYTGCNDLNP